MGLHVIMFTVKMFTSAKQTLLVKKQRASVYWNIIPFPKEKSFLNFSFILSNTGLKIKPTVPSSLLASISSTSLSKNSSITSESSKENKYTCISFICNYNIR